MMSVFRDVEGNVLALGVKIHRFGRLFSFVIPAAWSKTHVAFCSGLVPNG